MKVGYFTGTLHAGGLERFVTRVSIYANKERLFSSVVICLSKDEGIFKNELRQQNIPVYGVPERWFSHPLQFIKFVKFLNGLSLDLIHSQVNFSLLQQWSACTLAGTRFLVTERSCYQLSGLDLIKRRIQFYILKLFNVHYSANSKKVAEHLANLMRYSINKVPVIPNGVDVEHLELEDTSHLKNKYLPGYYGKIIGYVARFHPEKGHDLLVDVVKHLSNEIKPEDLKICLVGEGVIKPLILKKINKLGLKDYFVDLGLQSDMTNIYMMFNLVLLLSSREGMPNVVIESMAAGVPVFANPVGNIEELFNDNCGIVNYSSDSLEIAREIEILLRSDKIRRLIAINAKNKILTEFSLRNTVDKLIYYYKAK